VSKDSNFYQYVFNEPVNLIDQTGKSAIAIGRGGAAVGGAFGGPVGAAIGAGIGVGLGLGLDILMNQESSKEHSDEEKDLADMIDEDTNGGRKPLDADDTEAAIDLANELGLDTKDDRDEDHWLGGVSHIHIEKCRLKKSGDHIPALPR